jgi:hypothetical protein
MKMMKMMKVDKNDENDENIGDDINRCSDDDDDSDPHTRTDAYLPNH